MNSFKFYNFNNSIIQKYKSLNDIYCEYIFKYRFIQFLYYTFYINYKDNIYSKSIYTTEIINIGNDDLILATSNNKNFNKILIICHSVCGSYKELSYLASILIKHNILVVSYSRKCHEKSLKYSNFNIVGCTDTLDTIVNIIHYRYKNIPKYLLGISAGSSLAALYLGTKNKHIKSGILISPGYGFKHTMYNMPKFSQLLCYLNVYFYFKSYASERLNQSCNLIEYCDNLYKQHGYKNKHEYYNNHDPINYIHDINVPCIFINAEDDFVFPGEVINNLIKYSIQNKNIKVIKLKYGSHNSFKYKWNSYPWIYEFILEYITNN